MAIRRTIGVIPMAIVLSACTGQPWCPTTPFRTADKGVSDVSGETLEVSVEEAEAARSPQPALHALHTSQFFGAIARKHPELGERLQQLERRSLALTKLQLRAAHALAFQDMKNMKLSELADLYARWMADPTAMLAYLQTSLGRVESLDRRQATLIARKLPAISVALEDLGKGLPAKPSLARGLDLRKRVIRDFVAILRQRQPDRAGELSELEERLTALNPEQMKTLHASVWAENKERTLGEAVARLTTLIQTPGLYARHLQEHLSQLRGLTAQGRGELLAGYPAVFDQFETILFGRMQPAPWAWPPTGNP